VYILTSSEQEPTRKEYTRVYLRLRTDIANSNQREETTTQTKTPTKKNKARNKGNNGAPDKAAAQEHSKPRQERRTRERETEEGITNPKQRRQRNRGGAAPRTNTARKTRGYPKLNRVHINKP
jgi:hypothetical protein